MKNDLKGILVVKVFCGNLPVVKAQEHVNKFKNANQEEFTRIRNSGYEVIYIPSRSEDTTISKIEL